MLCRVQDVEARSEYRVWIRFVDGVEGEVDLSELVAALGSCEPQIDQISESE